MRPPASCIAMTYARAGSAAEMRPVQSGGPPTPHANSCATSLGTHGTCRGAEPPLGNGAATESMMRGRTHTWVNGIGFVPSGAYQLPLVDDLIAPIANPARLPRAVTFQLRWVNTRLSPSTPVPALNILVTASLPLVSRVVPALEYTVPLTVILASGLPAEKCHDHGSALARFQRTSCHDVPAALADRRRRMPSGNWDAAPPSSSPLILSAERCTGAWDA